MRRPIKSHALFLLASFALVLAFPASAHAFGMEYVVSDSSSFDSVAGAFKKAALIFGDSEYSGLFISIAVLGFLFAGIGAYVQLAMTGRPPGLTWTIMPFLGMAVYLAMIVPKGTLMVYDKAVNRQQAVAGLPIGVVAVFGLFNQLERGFIKMVETATSDTLSYDRQGGGIGFNMLRSLYDSGIPVPNEALRSNLVAYVNTCVSFEIDRPGSTLTIESLEKAPDLLTELAKADHPGIYVDYADAMGRTRVPCAEAWAGMKPELSDQVATFGPAVAGACQREGYDPKDPGAVDRCKESLSGLLGLIWKPGGGGGSMNAELMARNFFIADAFRNAFAADDIDTAVKLRAGQSIGNAGIAQAITAQDWLPVAQTVMLTIAIGLTPFVALFIPTPIFGRAIGVIAGLNIFLIAWKVTDAVIYSSLMDQAARVFAGAIGDSPGLSSVLMFQDSNMRALASFANARWQGAAVGMAVSASLVKIGGYAFAQLAGGMIGQQQSASTSAAAIATPEGGAQLASGVTRANIDMPNTMKWRMDEQVSAGTFEYDSRMAGSLSEIQAGVTAWDKGEAQAKGVQTNIAAMGQITDPALVGAAEGAGRQARASRTGVEGAREIADKDAAAAAAGAESATVEERETLARQQMRTNIAQMSERWERAGGEEGIRELTAAQVESELGRLHGAGSPEALGAMAKFNTATDKEKIQFLKDHGYTPKALGTGAGYQAATQAEASWHLLGHSYGPDRAGYSQAINTSGGIGNAETMGGMSNSYRIGAQGGTEKLGKTAAPAVPGGVGEDMMQDRERAIAAAINAGVPSERAGIIYGGAAIPRMGEKRHTERADTRGIVSLGLKK